MIPEAFALILDIAEARNVRDSVADARLAAGDLDTRGWIAAVRHTPARTRDATRALLREIRREVRRG